ncbi:mechanosensitive ion channel family protein [Adlercreutzia sp. ZJ138]|uniref:mechanosensitive ion channel family protein n=1 Tax=Adlercreutzia sp. ZJ138 TaxID=2709405 RepID=UPI001F14A8AC|nr:mechanosensitive ion channel family protein [Adlercreutzia sp. ZJ138]
MNPEEQTDGLRSFFQNILHVEWLSTALTVIVVLALTALLVRVLTKLLRRVLSHDSSPLPSSSIFVNIGRVAVWAIGISIVLSSCFNVDVSAAVAALGIGGIAISLGFQDTLANLIGGLQVSITGLVEPGDNIEVGGQRGVVRDVTWRHTTIVNAVGEQVVVPNSVINTSSLTKLRPLTVVSIPVVVTAAGDALSSTACAMEQAANEAVGAVCGVEVPAVALFSEVTDYGYRGSLTLTITDGSKVAAARDAALRSIAPFVHAE